MMNLCTEDDVPIAAGSATDADTSIPVSPYDIGVRNMGHSDTKQALFAGHLGHLYLSGFVPLNAPSSSHPSRFNKTEGIDVRP